jgi:hypothetical protein
LNTILPDPADGLKDFRVFVASLRPPYSAAFTPYHAHPDFACAAAVQFRIFPPLWIGCVAEKPQPLAAQLVSSALQRFAEQIVDSSLRRVPTAMRAATLQPAKGSRSVGSSNSRATLYYLFLEFAR